MKNITICLLSVIIFICFCGKSKKNSIHEQFTLKLRTNSGYDYEDELKNVPFIQNEIVYLFNNDRFGIRYKIENNKIHTISYEKDSINSNLFFKFKQTSLEDSTYIMLLELNNNTSDTIYINALMIIPEKNGVFKTSIVPLLPKMTNYESWPHPIIELILKDIRLDK